MAKKWIIYWFLFLFFSACFLYIRGERKPIKQNLEKALRSEEPRLSMKNVEILLYQGSVVVESLQSAELNLITDKRLTCQNGLKRVVYDAANPKEKKSEIRANEADISFEDSLLIDGDKIIRTDKLILTGNVHYKEDRIEIKSAEAEYSPLKAEMKGKGFVEVVLNGTKKIQGQEGFSFLSNEGLLDMFGIVSGEIRCN